MKYSIGRHELNIQREEKEFINIMRQSSDRLIETVQTIIDISKIESTSESTLKERFYLYESINEIIHKISTKNEKAGLEIIFKTTPGIEKQVIETNNARSVDCSGPKIHEQRTKKLLIKPNSLGTPD